MSDETKRNKPSTATVVKIVLTAIAVLLIILGVVLIIKGKEAGIAIVLIGVLLATRNIGRRRGKR